jgi:hypothetical protein
MNSFYFIKALYSDKILPKKNKGWKFLFEQQKRFCCLLKVWDVLLFQSNNIFLLRGKFFEESKSSHFNESWIIFVLAFSFLYWFSFKLWLCGAQKIVQSTRIRLECLLMVQYYKDKESSIIVQLSWHPRQWNEDVKKVDVLTQFNVQPQTSSMGKALHKVLWKFRNKERWFTKWKCLASRGAQVCTPYW